MPLTDPELELFSELLQDDPGAESFPRVGEELHRRGRSKEAYDILRRGLAANPHHDKGWETFVHVAQAVGDHVAVLEAIENVDADPAVNAGLARIRISALEKTGQRTRVRAACHRFLELHPGDAEVTKTLNRLDAPPPSTERTARDPFLTVDRAEAYVAQGRVDKAIRAYRRILYRHPHDVGVEKRLFELVEMPYEHDWIEDDLSEEILKADLTATGPAPIIDTPSPSIGHPDDEQTQPHSIEEIERTLAEIAARRQQLLEGSNTQTPLEGRKFIYGGVDDDEEEETARTEMLGFSGTYKGPT
ncbi:MAG: tetratricopeptide repeat protein [Deltaproteobacteria bacterium]|nr:MAG: tetratricopeptide repeat protein [Deltaproteobacteria bacterium]